MERTVNVKLLREYFEENAPLAKERVALASDYSVAAIEKMLSRKVAPRAAVRLRMARFTRIAESDLFPIRSRK